MTREDWIEKAAKGTSGDMVWDILRDWKSAEAESKCVWSEEVSHWVTGCGTEFVVNNGTFRDNHMFYCPCCGRKIHRKLNKAIRSGRG